MALQLGGLALKVPLNAAAGVRHRRADAVRRARLPALGVAGCGIATAIVDVVPAAARRCVVLRRDPFYAPLRPARHGLAPAAPRRACAALLRLGVPMGLAILIEVTGFTFMAFFISRIGATPVAGHQIAVNLVSLMFMLPLAIANATEHAGGAAHRRRRRRRRAPARLARRSQIGVADRRRARRRGVPAARADGRPVHRRRR